MIPLYDEIITSIDNHLDYEIIFIDDGSADQSNLRVQEIISQTNKVILISLKKNKGKSNALNLGFKQSKGDIVVTMDADLQDDPKEINNLIAKLHEGWDMVSGWKKMRKDPISKTFPSRIFNRVVGWISGLKIHDFNCGFKAYKTKVIKSLHIYGGLHRFIPYLAISNGFTVTELVVNHRSRAFGSSKYGGSRMFKGFFDFLSVFFVTKYSKRPLHIFGFIGFLFFLVGLIINILLTYQWMIHINHPGLKFTINRPLLFLGILFVIIGIQLFSMGFIAELIVSYLSKNEKSDHKITKSED